MPTNAINDAIITSQLNYDNTVQGSTFFYIVTVSTILRLQVGDLITVLAVNTPSGSTLTGTQSTHFEAARIPSPQKNIIL